VVSHSGLVLLRQLADRTGLTAGLSSALPSPLGGHDRGRVFADLACAIADGARVISDFRVMGDQRELLGPVASVPAACRALKETAAGGDRRMRKITAAVNKARRHAWAQGAARRGGLPPVTVADRGLEGVTCIRLDATVVTAHSDKERAEPDFKGYGHHPVIAACDNTAEPLAWMLRPGSAGSNTAAGHLRLLGDAITALPPALRRKLMITCDGAGASHALVTELDRGASRHGYQVTYSVGWELAARERASIGTVPEHAWLAAIDGRGEARERRADDACAGRRSDRRRPGAVLAEDLGRGGGARPARVPLGPGPGPGRLGARPRALAAGPPVAGRPGRDRLLRLLRAKPVQHR
jgi:DDE family transposase